MAHINIKPSLENSAPLHSRANESISGQQIEKQAPVTRDCQRQHVQDMVLLYGEKPWSTRMKEVSLLEKTEMHMFWWVVSITIQDKIRNETTREQLEVIND